MQHYTRRRLLVGLLVLVATAIAVIPQLDLRWPADASVKQAESVQDGTARHGLENLAIKGRASKTGYSREQFGGGWSRVNGCDTRNIILHRDLKQPVVDASCNVLSGVLDDPYTGKTIQFQRGAGSDDVKIDHVVALSDAWQKGAGLLSYAERVALANDPLELIAADGPANQEKSDSDAATWLPPNKAFRCQYVARQIAVKQKYQLWVTQAEYDTISRVLDGCPGQLLPQAIAS